MQTINTGAVANDGTGDELRNAFIKVNSNTVETVDALATKAPLVSPALTGNPTAPTQPLGNASTRLATTAFVNSALNGAMFKTINSESVKGVGNILLVTPTQLATKQNTLISGSNIKTVGGQSLVGSGNVTEVQGSLAPSATLAPSVNAVNSGLALKQDILVDNVTGTGTVNKIPKFDGAHSIIEGIMTDDGSTVTVAGVLVSTVIKKLGGLNTQYLMADGSVTTGVPSGGGGSGNTNLSYIPAPSNGTVTSDTGTPAVIPLASSVNAGLFSPAERTKLGAITGTNTGDETTASIKTKRPLKTIASKSLEGTGDVTLVKGDVGLGNVDNTSDLNKPISTATQTALNLKANDNAVIHKSGNEAKTGTLETTGFIKTGGLGTEYLMADGTTTTGGGGGTVPDASTTVKGIVKLAGDLAGTALLPTVPGLALKENSANKQNSLSTDGTGVKFPTVDAVNAVLLNSTVNVNASSSNQSVGGVAGTMYQVTLGNSNNTATISFPSAFLSTGQYIGITIVAPPANANGSVIITGISGEPRIFRGTRIYRCDGASWKRYIANESNDNGGALTGAKYSSKSTAITNKSTGVEICTDGELLSYNILNVNQTVAGQTPILPTPLGTVIEGVFIRIKNVGTQSFTLYGKVIAVDRTFEYVYSNGAWGYVGDVSSGGAAPDASPTVKGLVKLANDLGGTADAPTTPTALHKTGSESFTGIKSLTSTDALPSNMVFNHNGTTGNTSSLIYTNNNSPDGFGIQATGNSTGVNIISISNGGGAGIVSNQGASSNGLNFIGQNNGVSTYSVDKLGNVSAKTFVKQGGLSNQYLMADGSVTSGTSVPDATSSVKGILKLTNDLGGTADLPTVPGLTLKENTANKQNSLAYDGTGVKFPTVDGVNANNSTILQLASKTGLISSKDAFDATALNTTTIQFASIDKALFWNELFVGGTAPSASIKSFSSKTYALTELITATGGNSNENPIVGNGIFIRWLGYDKNGNVVSSANGFTYNPDVLQLAYCTVINTSGVVTFLGGTTLGGRNVAPVPAMASNTDFDKVSANISSVKVSSNATASFSLLAGNITGISVNWRGSLNPGNVNPIDVVPISAFTGNTPFASVDPLTVASVSAPAVHTLWTETEGGIAINNSFFNTTTQLRGTLANGSASIKRVLIGIKGGIFVQEGQHATTGAYNTLNDAKSDIFNVKFPDVILPTGLVIEIARIAFVKGGTDMSNPAQFYVVNTSSTGGSATSVAPISDATTVSKGIVKLAGDLAGTADLPTVPGLATKISGSGTANRLAKYSASLTQTDSSITDTGSAVTINNPTTVNGAVGGANTFLKFTNNAVNHSLFGSDGAINGVAANFAIFVYGTNDIEFSTNSTRYLIVKGSGRILMNKTTDDGVNQLQVAGSVVSTQFRLSALNTAPSTATATGTLGEIRIVNGFIYVCVATNTWQRTALATW